MGGSQLGEEGHRDPGSHAGGVEAFAENRRRPACARSNPSAGSAAHLPRRQTRVENDCVHLIQGISVEVPAVRRKQPCPAEDIARMERVEGRHSASRRGDAERHSPGAKSPRTRRHGSLADDRCPACDHDIAGTSCEHVEVAVVHSVQEAMRRELAGDGIHRRLARSAVGRPDRRGLLGDVDTYRAPGDASAAADAAGRVELFPPRPELVGHPLAVPAAHRLSNRTAVDVREIAREAGCPFADARARLAVRSLRLDIVAAEARRACHRAVAAAEASCGDIVPAWMLEVADASSSGNPRVSIVAAHAFAQPRR